MSLRDAIKATNPTESKKHYFYEQNRLYPPKTQNLNLLKEFHPFQILAIFKLLKSLFSKWTATRSQLKISLRNLKCFSIRGIILDSLLFRFMSLLKLWPFDIWQERHTLQKRIKIIKIAIKMLVLVIWCGFWSGGIIEPYFFENDAGTIKLRWFDCAIERYSMIFYDRDWMVLILTRRCCVWLMQPNHQFFRGKVSRPCYLPKS